jgi:hypothetical protein
MTLSSATPPVVTATAARRAGRAARRVVTGTWPERLARWGLVIRGIMYFVPGISALQWALGHRDRPLSQAGTIDAIGHQPLGRGLLVVVALGLAGYAVWGVARAVIDPLRRGRSPAGIALRIGYGVSAIAYAGLFMATVGLLTGSQARVEPPGDWTLSLMARPFGGVIVAAIGLCWVFGSGIAQIVTGWRRGFERDLELERMGRRERRWAIGLGRAGLVSRGIVFTITGVLLVTAALRGGPGSGSGLAGALVEVAHQPFGRTLLGAAGLGLMAFGAYSAMCARWMRMSAAPGTPPSHAPTSRDSTATGESS